MIIELASHMDEPLHSILPDILPAIVRRIDRGSTFKAFRTVNRLFKSCTDALYPTGDIDFADHDRTIAMHHNIPMTKCDTIFACLSDMRHWVDGDPINSDLVCIIESTNISEFYYVCENLRPDLFDVFVAHLVPIQKMKRWHPRKRVCRILAKELNVDVKLVKVATLVMSCRLSPANSKLYDAILRDITIDLDSRERLAPLSLIEETIDVYEWDFQKLSMNKNITKEFYLAHQDEDWNVYSLLIHTGLDHEFVKTLDWRKDPILREDEIEMILFERIDVPWEHLLEFIPVFINRDIICRQPWCADQRWQELLGLLRERVNVTIYEELTWKNYNATREFTHIAPRLWFRYKK